MAVMRETRRTLTSRSWISGWRLPMRAFEQPYLRAT
jgi:hypothetical protein